MARICYDIWEEHGYFIVEASRDTDGEIHYVELGDEDTGETWFLEKDEALQLAAALKRIAEQMK